MGYIYTVLSIIKTICILLWIYYFFNIVIKKIILKKGRIGLKIYETIIIIIPIVFFITIILSRIFYPKEMKCHSIKGAMPEGINKIIYLTKTNDGKRQIFQIDSEGELSELTAGVDNIRYWDFFSCRIHVLNGEIVINASEEKNKMSQYILREGKLIKKKEMELSANETTFGNITILKGDKQEISNDPRILFEDNNHDILLFYPMKWETWFPVKYDNNIYLLYHGGIYKIDPMYKWEKLFSAPMEYVDPKIRYGIYITQAYENNLYILSKEFFPEFVTKYNEYLANLIFFKSITYLRILDINTGHVIKKHVFPNNFIYTKYGNFRVLKNNNIIIDGRYLLNINNRQITEFAENLMGKEVIDFCIIYNN
mgnify:CR=1 FL=1